MPEVSSCRALVDQMYEEFVAGLPDELRLAACDLPARLEPDSSDDFGWSAVFDEVLLGLPTLLFAEFGRPTSPQLRASAQRAHLFALISGAILERLDGGMLEPDEELEALLGLIERERHRALAELRLLGADRSSSFTAAEREARSATLAEREVFEGRVEAGIPGYVAICSGKQSLAFPATMAAIVAAGGDVAILGHTHDLILGVALGVAFRGDVVNWLDHARSRRSWAVSLLNAGGEFEVLAVMFGLAIDAFVRAQEAATALGAEQLARWSEAQARELRARAERNEASAA